MVTPIEPTAGGLSTPELVRLVRGVFRPRQADRGLAILVDLPDERLADHAAWAARRALAADWCDRLRAARAELGLDRVTLAVYPNVRRNNADLPSRATVLDDPRAPGPGERPAGREVEMERLLAEHPIVLAPTELSATAPLKLLAPRLGFRAATMPGFSTAMIPALRLDWEEIHERCVRLKARLDAATGARVRFRAGGAEHELFLDLRHRRATASGGLVREPGNAGNLPSGETYVVPYEGERPGDPSRTAGAMPLELEGELLVYRIEGNRVRAVDGDGPQAARERREVASEPAYANLAELGCGVLADYGIAPIGVLLLDEKLGLHIALGRSDHFGGSVGAADFSAPDRVVHIDRVYLPEVQPAIEVPAVDLERDGESEPLMRDGRYV